MRKVINKMVTEEDLINTVAAAYRHGWRQVKLYFMCGLPTETDEDVLQIADMAKRVIETGRQVSGKRDIRCTVSIGGFVPKPHTPFQWVGPARRRGDGRPPGQAARGDPRPTSATARSSASATTTASPASSRDCSRAATAASARSSRPSGGTAAGSTAGASTSPTSAGCAARPRRFAGGRSTSTGTPPASASSPRSCPGTTSTPGWTRTGSGRTGRTPSTETEVDDCRWTPCFDCGVCPQMGTEIQIGPTGKTLLPLTVVNAGRDQLLESR